MRGEFCFVPVQSEKPHVTQVLVCDPRKNPQLKSGNKNDRIDARKLADLLRTGLLSAVYSGPLQRFSRRLSSFPGLVRSPFAAALG
jgi:hypothetical protein